MALVALMAVTLLGGGCRGGGTHGTDDTVAAGWEWFRSGEFGLAEKAFERAERAAGAKVSNRVEALYGQAVTWHLRRPGGDATRAAARYRAVMATAPDHELAGWSALGLARLPEALPPGREPPRDARLQGYQAVIDQFPNHPAAEEAFLLQQGLRLAEPASDAEPREVPNPWNRNLADTMTYGRWMQEVGLPCFITPMGDVQSGRDYTPLVDVADVISVHPGEGSHNLQAKTRAASGKTLWFYNGGMDRYSWGFYQWRSGAHGRFEWHWSAPEGASQGGYPGREWYNPFTPITACAPSRSLAKYPGGVLQPSALLTAADV